ncbi:MAG: GNAT family N-acetyltransferase [Anaerolineae bacterium]|jgi:predicted acetyltransferase|nr:GNAT family N-acetyltransferase [Anaerolineae bacterium]MBT7071414.1 GNAT family N-acetyltransferase [Anaerolineae bacterium]MBT7325512.1 GNAT family N-acetyltransferase [Anaerolineae bacterium]
MRLEVASLQAPRGLAELIVDLGIGENGFGGTTVPSGELTLDEYLQHCVETNDHTKLEPGHIPRSFFWLLDGTGEAVGIVRMWHYLSKSLKERTGHISYYIRRDQRGKGYGQEALRQALIELEKVGERKALIVADLDNIASTKVILVNGGKLESIGQGGKGKKFGRYWIRLDV